MLFFRKVLHDEMGRMKSKLDAITDVFEDMNEKMFEFDKATLNSLHGSAAWPNKLVK